MVSTNTEVFRAEARYFLWLTTDGGRCWNSDRGAELSIVAEIGEKHVKELDKEYEFIYNVVADS